MSILEFVEARQEHDRTRKKPAAFPYKLSTEPGRELLESRYDEVVRIALWFIRHQRSRNSVEGVGGEEELLQQTLLTILQSRPKTPVSLTTRVCHCVIWAHGKMWYEINRKLEAKHERVAGVRDRVIVDSEFDRVDKQDLEQFFWRTCARTIRNDRRFRILFRWWKEDVDQTVMAEEQGVTRQMISLLMKQAERKILEKKTELEEIERLMFERRR